MYVLRMFRRFTYGFFFLVVIFFSLTESMAADSDHNNYPERAITLVMPMPAGGPTDQLGRLVAQSLGQELGKPVVVKNQPGAGGTVGATAVAQSEADGYTLLFANTAALAGSPALYKRLSYDPIKSFKAISAISTGPLVVVVNSKASTKSLGDLLDLAKSKPGALNYGSAGNGSPAHIAGEILKINANVNLTHVPYKGGGPALTALLAGETQVGIDLLPPLLPYLRAGTVRALAVVGPVRLSAIGDVPTTAEAGVAGVELDLFTALVAPAGTPEPIVEKLNVAMQKVLESPDFKNVAEKLSFFLALPGTLDEAEKFISGQVKHWGKSVELAKARID